MSISGANDCSLVAGLSVTLTFLVTVIISSLVALVVIMCLHKRSRHHAPLYETPLSGSEEKALKISSNVAYEHVQPHSTAQVVTPM